MSSIRRIVTVLVAAAALSGSVACQTDNTVDPEGYLCDPDRGTCPSGYACLGGICHRTGCATGGATCDAGHPDGGRADAGPACSSATCDGCCEGNVCLSTGAQRDSSCGLGGQACATCSNATHCLGGACAYLADAGCAGCAGCCVSDSCVPLALETSSWCGPSGQACAACTQTQSCGGDGVVGVCGSAGVIAWHGTTQVSFGPTPVTAFSLSAPNASRAGDLVVAVVWLGGSNNAVAPTLNPPVGWALIRRIDHTTVGTLAVYQHVYAVTDSSFTWTSSETLLGMMWMSSYGGVRTTSPIDAEDGWDLSLDGGTSVDTPPISAPAGDAVIVAFTGFSDPTAGLWGSLPEFSARVNANNGGARQGLGADQVLQTSITQQSYSDTSTAGLSYALTFALAIHPAP